MNLDEARELVGSYWAREGDRDIAKVMEHYIHDCVFWGAGAEYVGFDAVQSYYEAGVTAFPALSVAVVRGYGSATGDTFAFSWRGVFTSSAGLTATVDGMNEFEFDGDRFRRVSAYYDPAPLAAITGAA